MVAVHARPAWLAHATCAVVACAVVVTADKRGLAVHATEARRTLRLTQLATVAVRTVTADGGAHPVARTQDAAIGSRVAHFASLALGASVVSGALAHVRPRRVARASVGTKQASRAVETHGAIGAGTVAGVGVACAGARAGIRLTVLAREAVVAHADAVFAHTVAAAVQGNVTVWAAKAWIAGAARLGRYARRVGSTRERVLALTASGAIPALA